MKAVTWKVGSDSYHDVLFENLRQKHEIDKNHSLWKNYNKEHFFSECSALTIVFENDEPILCSSILNRDCWPNEAYRIMNRLWRTVPANNPLIKPHLGVAKLIESQLLWLEKNTNFKLVFMSRQTDNWQKWTVDKFKYHYNLNFKFDHYKYLTCCNHLDNACWQYIVYQGDDNLLKNWKRK